jgi:hypothetical protein
VVASDNEDASQVISLTRAMTNNNEGGRSPIEPISAVLVLQQSHNEAIMKGINRLDHFSPPGFELLYCTASGLDGLFQSTICKVADAAAVERVLKMNITM